MLAPVPKSPASAVSGGERPVRIGRGDPPALEAPAEAAVALEQQLGLGLQLGGERPGR